MISQITFLDRKGYDREDGMLFVRNDGILETMVKAPMLLAGLIFVVLVMPIHTSFGSTRTLDLTLYADGSTHVSSQLDVDPLEPILEMDLFGPSVDNFIAVDENGIGLTTSEISENIITVNTFDSSSITVDYDIHDLISKEGRIWTFSFNSPTNYSLLMPPNSIIVGISTLPSNMELENEQTRLELSSGLSEINYIFSTINPDEPITNPDEPITNPDEPITNPDEPITNPDEPITNPDEPITNPDEPITNPDEPITNPDEPITNPDEPITNVFTIALIGIILFAVVVTGVLLKKRKQNSSEVIQTKTISEPKNNSDLLDTETIFNLRPEMREDDKEIIRFIFANGGQALESDLRKKFLQPRTTMWRAVKRLERQGVIEISKKDLQNLVKLKKKVEEEY